MPTLRISSPPTSPAVMRGAGRIVEINSSLSGVARSALARVQSLIAHPAALPRRRGRAAAKLLFR
jgi:hypothetical protein